MSPSFESTFRAMKVRKRHFSFAADAVFVPSRFREEPADTRIRGRAWSYHCAWVACEDVMWSAQT